MLLYSYKSSSPSTFLPTIYDRPPWSSNSIRLYLLYLFQTHQPFHIFLNHLKSPLFRSPSLFFSLHIYVLDYFNCLIQSSTSLLKTCNNHFNLFSWNLSTIEAYSYTTFYISISYSSFSSISTHPLQHT